MSSTDLNYSHGIGRFVRRDIEYRLVESIEPTTGLDSESANIYEYNRLLSTEGVPLRRYSEGGIADGFVAIGKDGEPIRPPVSYVVLDQHLLQDSALIDKSLTDVPIQNRDYNFYKKALDSLSSLDRVNVLKQGKSLEVISGGRRYAIDFTDEVIVYDGAEGELFSYADIVMGNHTYNGVEIKVEADKDRVYVYDRRYGKGEVAELPIKYVDDITDPEKRSAVNLKKIADLSRALSKESAIRDDTDSAVIKPQKSVQTPILKTPVKQQHKPSKPAAFGSMLENFVMSKPVSKQTMGVFAKKNAIEKNKDTKSSGQPIFSQKSEGGPDKQGLSRPSFVDSTTQQLAESASQPKKQALESTNVDYKKGSPLGELQFLFENKKANKEIERAYELDHGKARVVFVYSPDEHVVVQSVQTVEFVYPGAELVEDWEQIVDQKRKKLGKFESDDREKDLMQAKRKVVDVARSVYTYKLIMTKLAKKSKEYIAVNIGLEKLVKDTTQKYGKIFR